MKKALSIALALVLAIGMLAGCGGGGETVEQADISAFVETDEKLEISWLSYYTLSGCGEGTASEKLIEDTFNIEMKPIFAESAKYNDKKNALLQSGDIPDLIYELDPMTVYADARDEYLLEIPYAAIEKYAPELFKSINEKAPAAWAYAYYEGANYGLPNMNHAHMEGNVAVYRKDWLDKFGFEVPTTIDELHEVLYAFANNDPDGNGKKDTYGYANNSPTYTMYFGEVFGAYGAMPFDWIEKDGEIVYGGLQEEVVTALSTLAQWYKEGIIYPAFIESQEYGSQLIQSGTIGYCPASSYNDPNAPDSDENMLKVNFPEGELVNAKMVRGPEGKFGMRSWGYPCHVVSFGNKGEESPVKATKILQMLEGMYTNEDLLTEIRLGKEGFSYTRDENNTGVNTFVATKDFTEGSQKRLAGYEFGFSGPTFFSPITPSEELYQKNLTPAIKEWQAKYSEIEACLTDLFYKVDIVPSAPTYIQDMRNGQQALMAQIITGKMDASQYIPEFTKIWESTGGPQMLDEAKQQGAILAEIYSKIGIEG